MLVNLTFLEEPNAFPPDYEFGFKLIRMKEGWMAALWDADSFAFSAYGWGDTPDAALKMLEGEVGMENGDLLNPPEWVERAAKF